VNIIIGGDICPSAKDQELFERGDSATLFGPLLSEFLAAGFSVINLECPLYDANTPILKAGPNLKTSAKSINGLYAAGIQAVNLANNHVLDHGTAGLHSTMETCNSKGIITIGAGQNLNAARHIEVISVQDIRIGILGIAEHEFSTATDQSWGANPLDLIDYVRNVRARRAEYDYLIVLLHGGCEHYPFPSPRLRETCHFLVEEGASIVVCQHSHCAGCYEEYQGSYIVYGQGNLLFNLPNKGQSWYEGFLVKLEIEKDKKLNFSIKPFQQSKQGPGVCQFPAEEEIQFVSLINSRSQSIQAPGYVKTMWDLYCEKMRYYYLSRILGQGRVLRKLTVKSKGDITRLLYSREGLLGLRNVITCESHREIIESLFERGLLTK